MALIACCVTQCVILFLRSDHCMVTYVTGQNIQTRCGCTYRENTTSWIDLYKYLLRRWIFDYLFRKHTFTSIHYTWINRRMWNTREALQQTIPLCISCWRPFFWCALPNHNLAHSNTARTNAHSHTRTPVDWLGADLVQLRLDDCDRPDEPHNHAQLIASPATQMSVCGMSDWISPRSRHHQV